MTRRDCLDAIVGAWKLAGDEFIRLLTALRQRAGKPVADDSGGGMLFMP